jgi:hypothetical protein
LFAGNYPLKTRKKVSGYPEDSGMKREHARVASRNTAQSEVVEGQPDQGVNGSAETARIDLQGAMAGEYRFQGEQVRAFYADGRTWFVAAEVCAVLELANPRQVISSLRATQKGVSILDTPGGAQTVNLINESALYVLIFKSRKPQAEAFQTWVTDEVLPQIRRTGSYSVDGQLGQDGSIVLPPCDGETRYVVLNIPGRPPHIRRTGVAELLAENTSLDVQGLCYALKGIEVWWNKAHFVGQSTPARDERFSAQQLEQAVLSGAKLADSYLRLLEYSKAAE